MERKHVKYQRLIDFCKTLPPTPTAVAHPCDESSLRGAVDAAKLGPYRTDPGRSTGADRGSCDRSALRGLVEQQVRRYSRETPFAYSRWLDGAVSIATVQRGAPRQRPETTPEASPRRRLDNDIYCYRFTGQTD
jgi:hypothetical protein